MKACTICHICTSLTSPKKVWRLWYDRSASRQESATKYSSLPCNRASRVGLYYRQFVFHGSGSLKLYTGSSLGVACVGASIADRLAEARSLLLQAHLAGAVPPFPSGKDNFTLLINLKLVSSAALIHCARSLLSSDPLKYYCQNRS